jgi:RecA-family ATPase
LTADIINKALEVAENYPVFPCNNKKQPLCKWREAATQDPNKIERMFSNPSAALIGMPTGYASGISVIDIDVNNGKQGKKWLEDNRDKLGNTLYAQTQSGGWHFYYNHKDGLANAAGLGNGAVDIRGEGGYVITSPSDGYKFLNDEDLIDFPDFLLGSSLPEVFTPNNTEPVTDMFGSITDGREKYMSDLVYASIMNYRKDNGSLPSEEYMVENVWTIYALKVKSRHSDGLEAEDRGISMFMKKVRSTLAKLKRKDAPVLGEFDDPEPMPEYVEVDDQGERKFDIPVMFNSDIKDMPPPSFLVAPYILENSFAVLFGAPASYKSFLALDWALSIAHGVDWNGRAVKQGWVVYLALEGQQGYKQRQLAWHNENGLDMNDAQLATVTVPVCLADPAQDGADIYKLMESLDYSLKDKDIKLIVVDTLARAFTGHDENQSLCMGVFCKNTSLLMQRYDCALLTVHHSGKNFELGLRGSSALQGAADSTFSIKRQGDSMVTCLKTTKQKDTEEAEPLYLEAREVSWHEVLGVEQTSLVLDPRDAPPKKIKMSDDQRVALNILDSLLQDQNAIEKDGNGLYGIRESLFRDVVVNSLPNLEKRQAWHNFKKRMEKAELIKVINGLVSKVNV